MKKIIFLYFFLLITFSCRQNTYYKCPNNCTTTLPLLENNGVYECSIKIEENKYNALADTGAGLSWISNRIIQKPPLGDVITTNANGQSYKTKKIKINEIQLGEILFKNFLLTSSSEANMNSVILGNDIFKNFTTEFNFKNKTLIIGKHTSKIDGDIIANFKLTAENLIILSNVSINNKIIDNLVLDTGFNGEILLNQMLLSKNEPYTSWINRTTYFGKKTTETLNFYSTFVNINGKVLPSSVIYTPQTKYNRIGVGFLKSFSSIIIDNVSKKVYFKFSKSQKESELNGNIWLKSDFHLGILKKRINSFPINIERVNTNYLISSVEINRETRNTINLGDTIVAINNVLINHDPYINIKYAASLGQLGKIVKSNNDNTLEDRFVYYQFSNSSIMNVKLLKQGKISTIILKKHNIK